MKRRPLKPWHGLTFFILIMTAFFFICVPMQMWWGIYGLAATELLILVMALVFAKIMGYPLKVLFPLKKPGFFPLLGTVIIWVSAYLITMVVMLIEYRLFPKQVAQVSGGLNDTIGSVTFLLSVFIVCIMPAVCEEAVHRGIIIHSLYSIRREWVVVLLMGIYFGCFHSDPIRFLPTALLGTAMSYIMLETENMVYSSFFHCINNLLPLILQQILIWAGGEQITRQAQELAGSTAVTIPIASIGIYVVFAAVTPFGLYLGNYLLHHKKGVYRKFIPAKKNWQTVLGIVIPTVCIFGIGVITLIYGVLFDPAMQELLRESAQFTIPR